MENQETSVSSHEENKNFFVWSFLSVLVGAALSFYATIHHIELKSSQGATQAMCNVNNTVSCDKVAASPYSEIFSIPLGVWGGGFFLSLFFLLLWAHSKKERRKNILTTYGFLVSLGALASVILAVISFTMVKALCLVCLGIYFCNFFQTFIFWKNRKDFWEPSCCPRQVIGPILVTALAFGIAIGAYSLTKPRVKKTVPVDYEYQPGQKPLAKTEPTKNISISRSAYSKNGEDYRRGSEQAKIVIHEFADFQCPACRYMSDLLKEVQSELGSDKVMVVFRNFPLDKACNPEISQAAHPLSCMAAKIARCGGQLGKFWEFHDAIFASQEHLSEGVLRAEAARLGLGGKAFDKCLQDEAITAKLRSDSKEAVELEVQGTPSLFINGKPYQGEYSKGAIAEAIKSLL